MWFVRTFLGGYSEKECGLCVLFWEDILITNVVTVTFCDN
jgi:hypothetical protein